MPIAGLTNDQLRRSLEQLDLRIPAREHRKGREYRSQVPHEIELDGTRLLVEIQVTAAVAR